VHYITQPVPIQQPHRNHGLFSDHYLNETLPQRSDWRELADEAKPVMDELKRVFERYGPVRGEKEARTEKYWVRPVLEALGHAAFEERPSLKVPGDPQEPDYVFYNSQGARDSRAG
jgi:hypothetical protein